MTQTVVIGAGWHPRLFRLEAVELIADADFIHPHALVCTDATALVESSSLITEVLSPSGLTSIEAVIEEASAGFLALEIPGTVAVVAGRTGNKVEGWSSRTVAGEIGGRLVQAGRAIDLSNPDVILRVHLLAISSHPVHPDSMRTDPVVVWGITTHEGDDWATRTAPMRPFFKPVSLDPKLARAMVNLACPNGGRLLDPFCGTGGIIVEGVLRGLDCAGSDLAWPMVTGTRENAAWAQGRGGTGIFEILNASALELQGTWTGPFDGFVFDPPYGRNAWKSGDGFELLQGALSECAALAHEASNLVTLIPWNPQNIDSIEDGIAFGKTWEEISESFTAAGWSIESTAPIRVHRSLARLLIHAKKE